MHRNRVAMAVVAGLGALAVLAGAMSCSGQTPAPAPAPVAAPPPEPAKAKAPSRPEGPLPALLMVQSQAGDGGPGPAKLTILRTDGKQWYPEVIEDPESNVFHKAIPWRDGILTIGATKAKLKHWTRDGDTWKATTLWEKSWLANGGKFDRLRDVEIGDVDADGKDEIVLVTHDRGVVAVGEEAADGTWQFREFDEAADTFVHEAEIGDVDGDGKKEFYATPSGRNRASGASQPGGVVRYDSKPDGTYTRTPIAEWAESHAKEILVVDLDADGKDELYVAREGHVVKEGEQSVLKSPAAVLRLEPGPKGKWKESVVAELVGEKQCRFLVPGDVDGDGKLDLVAAGMETGLWKLSGTPAQLVPTLIEADTGGFEHATDVADLDGDGKLEIYAVSEKPGTRVLRKYWFENGTWKKQDIVPIPKKHITWNLQDARL